MHIAYRSNSWRPSRNSRGCASTAWTRAPVLTSVTPPPTSRPRRVLRHGHQRRPPKTGRREPLCTTPGDRTAPRRGRNIPLRRHDRSIPPPPPRARPPSPTPPQTHAGTCRRQTVARTHPPRQAATVPANTGSDTVRAGGRPAPFPGACQAAPLLVPHRKGLFHGT